MNYNKVQGKEHLVRDPRTNSIINTNTMEYQQYMRNKQNKQEEQQKIQNLESDVAKMRDDLDEIKFLLRRLANES